MFNELINKKVKIVSMIIGTGMSNKFTGTVVNITIKDSLSFIELDTGEYINMRYINYIIVLE